MLAAHAYTYYCVCNYFFYLALFYCTKSTGGLDYFSSLSLSNTYSVSSLWQPFSKYLWTKKSVTEFWKWKTNIVYYFCFKDVTTKIRQFLLMKICLISMIECDISILWLSKHFLFAFIYHLKIGSEGSFLMKKNSSSTSVGEFYRDPALQRCCSPNLQKHSNSLVS